MEVTHVSCTQGWPQTKSWSWYLFWVLWKVLLLIFVEPIICKVENNKGLGWYLSQYSQYFYKKLKKKIFMTFYVSQWMVPLLTELPETANGHSRCVFYLIIMCSCLSSLIVSLLWECFSISSFHWLPVI